MLIRLTRAISSAAAVLATATTFLLSGAMHEPADALVGINCGAPLSSVLRLENTLSSTSSTAFVNLSVVNVFVPNETIRCIKVLFTAEAVCRGPTNISDSCLVRVLDNGVEMHPQGASNQILLSEAPTASAHAFEWVSRVGGGNHQILLQRRVGNAATVFQVDDWTFDVQLTN